MEALRTVTLHLTSSPPLVGGLDCYWCHSDRTVKRTVSDANPSCQHASASLHDLSATSSQSISQLFTLAIVCLLIFAHLTVAATADSPSSHSQFDTADKFYAVHSPLAQMQMDQAASRGQGQVVVSGQKAMLVCPLLASSKALLPSSAASSSPTSPIKWYKESTALPSDHRHHVQANGTLVIASAQKRTDEGSYFCALQVANEVASSNAISPHEESLKQSAIITLRVIEPPRVGPYEFPADLQIGMKARAMCSVMQGDPPFRFGWTQDGRRIESDVPTSDTGAIFRTKHFSDYSMLTVESLTLAHAGNITCLVSNDAAKTSQSALLKINAPPQWLAEPQDTQVVLHQSTRIDCLATGSPKPFTTWKRATGGSPWEYVPIYNSAHYYLHPNGSLSVMAVTQAQAGPYICQSTNGYGADIGKLIHLKVNEPPRFAVQSASQSAHRDVPVRLVCQPEGDRPIRMEWSLLNGTQLNELMLGRDNHHQTGDSAKPSTLPFEIKEIPFELLNEESNNIEESSSVSTASTTNTNAHSIVSLLTIRRPGRDDSRVFVCKASNDFGWSELKIRLLVKERPDAPEEFSILNVTESTAEIRWRESFNGNAPIVSYVVEHRVAESEPSGSSAPSSPSTSSTIPVDRVTANGSLRVAQVTTLRPNTVYNIRLAAQNQIGQSDFTSWTRFRTEQSAPESPPLDVTATPTGPNSVKITWKSPRKSTWNGEISGYYIGYRAENSDTDLYKTVEGGPESGNGKHESHITNLHRSTVYEAWVQAFNARGTGPRSEVALVRTLADVPPSAPLLRLHTSTTDSITISWSPAAFGSRSSNDLTLYYRPYQPSSSEHSTANGGTVLRNVQSALLPNSWRDISILEPTGRHTVSGLECGRAYEFFATAHNSVGKSEPSTPLVARTRGDAPSPPPRGDLLSEVNPHGAVINLLNWKSNECQINYFSMRIRTKSNPVNNIGSSQAWSILAMHHNPRENFVLRKLIPNTAYEIEVTAHSAAGSTQVTHHFVTGNGTGETFYSKMGYDSKAQAAFPISSTSEISFSDYEILLPVVSSLIVVVVIVAVACFLCSRDHHSLFLQPALHGRQRQQSTSSENKVPFQQQEMSILKELVRSSSVTIGDSHTDSVLVSPGVHHSPADYSCLNGEPASLVSVDHLNHHHLLNSPHHPANSAKKDLVELQSFYHPQQQQSSTVPQSSSGYYHHHPHSMALEPKTGRTASSGNYALPYDVLPVNRSGDNSNMSQLYGQRIGQVNKVSPSSGSAAMVESLYATTKSSNFNHYCQKNEDSQGSDSSTRNTSLSNRTTNYESLVPIICTDSRR